MWRNLVFRLILVFLFTIFGFHAIPGTTNNHWTGLSEISYKNLFSRNSNDIKQFQKIFQC